MSWSRSYSGTAAEVLAQARSQREEIKSTLPDFEKNDMAYVVEAAEVALDAVPEGAKVSLNINGHGSRSSDGSGSGAMGLSINYTLVATD